MPRPRTISVLEQDPVAPDVRPRSLSDLVAMQLSGIAAFHRLTQPGQHLLTSREQRMDATRAGDVAACVHAALVERTGLGLTGAGQPLCWPSPPRAVLAVRHEWFRDMMSAALVKRGIEVVAQPDNGAEALGIVIAEQPDLLLTQDKMAMLSGLELVQLVRQCAPATLSVGQVSYADEIGPMIDAGAVTACTRRMTPNDVADSMVALLDPAGLTTRV